MRISARLLGSAAAASLLAWSSLAMATPGKPAITGKPATAGKPAASTMRGVSKPGPASRPHAARIAAPTRLNPIAAKIGSKPNLNAKVRTLLPLLPNGQRMSLNQASMGFKNQGQFIAALHVSRNLGIPFSELKSHLVTVTPATPGHPATATQTGSLGQAIQAVKQTANAGAETERAESQASADLHTTTAPRQPASAGKIAKKTAAADRS